MIDASRSWCVGIAAAIMLAAAPAMAAKCADAEFPERVNAAGGNLMLNGLGLRKATFLKVKVYVAGLYLPEKSTDAARILGATAPWRLELHFLRDVGAADMKEAFREGFENTGTNSAPLKQRIDSLVGMFVDFKQNQRLAFTNDPAKGVSVELDGAPKGTVAGADFASALLAIWLGRKPPNDEIKSGLLGGACE